MSSSIRLATEHDAEAIHAIYAPVVRDTPISFEWEPPTVSGWDRSTWRRASAQLLVT